MDFKSSYLISLRLLQRRDYSEHELRQKLIKRKISSETIDETIEKLLTDNYLNDQRYINGKMRYFIKQKKSPAYIQNKCFNMGVPVSLEDINFHFDELKVSIKEHIRDHIKKKLDFGRIDLNNLSDKERFNLSYKLSNHLFSKGYKDFNVPDILKEVS